MPHATPAEFLDDPAHFGGRLPLSRQLRLDFTDLELRQEHLDEAIGADSAILCGGPGWGKTLLGRLRLLYALHRALHHPWEPITPESTLHRKKRFLIAAMPEHHARVRKELDALLCLCPSLQAAQTEESTGRVLCFPFGLNLVLEVPSMLLAHPPSSLLGALIDLDLPTERSLFLRVRDAMRFTGEDRNRLSDRPPLTETPWRGSLTWCTEAPVPTGDPRTRVIHRRGTLRPTLPQGRTVLEETGWHLVIDHDYRAELRQSPKGPSLLCWEIEPEWMPAFHRDFAGTVYLLTGIRLA